MSENDIEGPLTLMIVMGIVLHMIWTEYQSELIALGIILLSTVVGCFLLVLSVRYLRRKVKERQEEEKSKLGQKQSIQKEREMVQERCSVAIYDSLLSFEEQLKEFNIFVRSLSTEVKKEYEGIIRRHRRLIREAIAYQKEQEKLRLLKEQKQLGEKRKREEAERRHFQQQVAELLSFKLEKKDAYVLPINKTYPYTIIRRAENEARAILEKQEEKKQMWQEALEYYQTHDLNTKPYIENEKKEAIYTEVREQATTGKLQLKKKPMLEYRGKKLPKDFYRAKNLTEEERRRALAQGFEHVRMNELTGRLQGGGFYIRKLNSRETKYHFCTKYLFAELHDNMQVEYAVEGMRVDVALFFENFALGIEIETGANRAKQLAAKIPWLNKHFDQWMFVCPRKLQKRYDKLVDNDKSFCMTPKKAMEYVLELIPPTEHR